MNKKLFSSISLFAVAFALILGFGAVNAKADVNRSDSIGASDVLSQHRGLGDYSEER